jgi:hypothetical protein
MNYTEQTTATVIVANSDFTSVLKGATGGDEGIPVKNVTSAHCLFCITDSLVLTTLI